MQKPHWSAWASQNACCSGCSAVVVAEALDGLDVAALGLDGEHQAAADRGPVDDDGAGAAHALLAAHVRAGEAQLLAQELRQRHARLGQAHLAPAVDAEAHGHGLPGHAVLPSAERTAAASVLRTRACPAVRR